MKLFTLLFAILLAVSLPAAAANDVQPYKCTNKHGESGLGTGRLSKEGEYLDFLKKNARAGEFVIFQYGGKGREYYWFKAAYCSKA